MSSAVTILTVDDSALARKRFVATPLREAGYEVVEATNGQEGLAAIAQHAPACVISDLLMPVMDGFEFIQAARAQGYRGPVVVVSADIQQTSRDRVHELGISTFLNKPFDKDDLLKVVDEALSSANPQEYAACN